MLLSLGGEAPLFKAGSQREKTLAGSRQLLLSAMPDGTGGWKELMQQTAVLSGRAV